jgi:hypothetical protein
MITFKRLGRWGRLGNQLFQYATMVSVAKRNYYDYGIPKENTLVSARFGDTENVYKCDIFDLFDADKECHLYDNLIADHYYEDLSCYYNTEVFNIKDNTDILGYFQGEQYFLWCEALIREKFRFRSTLVEEAKKYMDVSLLRDPIALHVRRGDYLNLQTVHPIPPIEYYKKSLEMLDHRGRVVLVFSDDVSWVKENLAEELQSLVVVETHNQNLDLILMSQCKDFVIANSSFSWWGAWLSENSSKRVMCPKNWFGNHTNPLQQMTRHFELV